MMKKMVALYTDIVDMGESSSSEAAIYKLAIAYKNLSDTIVHSPIPPKLNEEESEVYRSELQNKALPIEDKAITMMEELITDGKKQHVITEWTEKAYSELAQWKPRKYGNRSEFKIAMGTL